MIAAKRVRFPAFALVHEARAKRLHVSNLLLKSPSPRLHSIVLAGLADDLSAIEIAIESTAFLSAATMSVAVSFLKPIGACNVRPLATHITH